MYRREEGLKDFYCNRQNVALFVDLLKNIFSYKGKISSRKILDFLYLIFFVNVNGEFRFNNKVSSMGVNLLDH